MSIETELNPVADKQSVAAVSMMAMSLNIPTDPHPNRMPFSGVLTRIGAPSDTAPEGSGGRRVMITAEAAKKALDSLLGMAVDYQPEFDGHDPKAKIGVITAADIDGDAIVVKGFIYAADFPDIAAQIKENKSELGMSFEARDLWTYASDADPMPIIDCVFTGAAILFKEKAAYKTTSIAAQAAQTISQEDIDMSEEIKKQLADLAAAVTKVSEAVAAQGEKLTKIEEEKVQAANLGAKVEPHAKRLEDAADRMEDDGIGAHDTRGHAAVLRHMAGHLRAAAAAGQLPHIYEGGDFLKADGMYCSADEASKKVATAVEAEKADAEKKIGEMKAAAEKSEAAFKDQVASLETQVKDLKAAADKAKAAESAPDRKTLTPGQNALLAKAGVEMPTDGSKLQLAELDKMFASAGLTNSQRLELKTALARIRAID